MFQLFPIINTNGLQLIQVIAMSTRISITIIYCLKCHPTKTSTPGEGVGKPLATSPNVPCMYYTA